MGCPRDTHYSNLIPGGGTYSRPISTDSAEAQAFFDQGLRMAWSFYFPESIASYQEASRPGVAEARAAFESAMAVEHDHPGANHLYIHLMEASNEPELAMPSAQKLEGSVPICGSGSGSGSGSRKPPVLFDYNH